METIHSVNAAARSTYGPEASHEEAEPKTQGAMYKNKPTEHQIRGETNATPPAAENQLPATGPGQAIYLNKPTATTTSETSKLTNESPSFQNLSLGSSSPPLKDTAAVGHRRADSGVGGVEVNTTEIPRAGAEPGAYQKPGHERVGNDDGDDYVQRTAREIDNESLTTEGYPRPVFVGREASEDDIFRADGRDRVKFDDSVGSTGSLKPSGEPNPERPRQGSAGVLPHMDLGMQGGVPLGARIGTVQGGTVKDRQYDLEAAQAAQNGGLSGIPLVFGTGDYDSTGTTQVQKEPNVKRSTEDSNLRQAKSIPEDEAQVQQREEQGKPPQEDHHLQRELGKEKTISQSTQKNDDSCPDTDAMQKPHPTIQASPTSVISASTQRSDEHPSPPNEPHSQGGTTNAAAATSDISPMEPGLSKGTHSLSAPSVDAGPAHVQQETQKHQDGDRPTEEPKGSTPQSGQGRHGSQGTQGEEKKKEDGHSWLKTTGTAAEGGDFDASKPGAGREADRLLEKSGVHRSVDPRQKKGAGGDTKKGVKGNQHDTTISGNPANPTHHPDSAVDSGKHGRLHIPGILHHHDANKDTATSEGGSAHKGGFGEKLEKIKEKVKLRKD